MPTKGNKHIYIPDPHAHPDYNNDRFKWLGRFILDEQPTHIICAGDLADMPSLCSYDKGTKGFEGRRYKRDIEANKEANKFLFEAIENRNKRRSTSHKKLYTPKTFLTLGNHEYRIVRATNADPILDGTVCLSDLENEKYWKTVVPFLVPVIIDGVAYSHYFTSGIMNRPIGGENPARALLLKNSMSCTVGHSHTRDFAETVRADGKRIQGLVGGCYQDYEADFAGPANKLWWRGVIVKENVKEGEYEHRWVSLDTIKERYS